MYRCTELVPIEYYRCSLELQCISYFHTEYSIRKKEKKPAETGSRKAESSEEGKRGLMEGEAVYWYVGWYFFRLQTLVTAPSTPYGIHIPYSMGTGLRAEG